ncbi:HAMP domain-containing protein [Agarivorans sp. B2Z047]|uniref:methyl-accepting chemotaxis protein n=1 Tax=Agarivorans sp. B2Z047 TaxID=2652721 RepID=UPI00128DF93F|nr:methyl-accepting chemotaxis protein [Agarivorans sp. B2Z047]MPW28184.1 HAMP domain-containing protein [Agarivorans sp. B2Z047]UQN43985.1 methyl-accepting chemotaxis protein [Agarivorans sp. B2Z047]
MNINSSLRRKYTLVFVFQALFFVFVAGYFYYATLFLDQKLQDFSRVYSPSIAAVTAADRDLYQARLAEALLFQGELSPSKFESLNKDSIKNAQQAFDGMQTFVTLMSEQNSDLSHLASFRQVHSGWQTQHENVFSLVEQQLKTGNAQQIPANESAFEQLREQFKVAGDIVEALMTEQQSLVANKVSQFKKVIIAMVAMVIIISVLCSWFVPKYISQSIKQVTEGINSVNSGDGNLQRRIESTRKDEIGQLVAGFNDFVGSLAQLVKGIKNESSSLDKQTVLLKSEAEKSSQLSQSQYQAMEAIVTAVNQMSVAIKEVALSASNTADEMETVNKVTINGQETLEQSVQKIESLSDKISSASVVIQELSNNSEQIVTVLDVIRGISEQTNLLALNAAIEAARAGEQGRGFAVVADEVRNLASKTRQSTENIQEMITNLQDGVKQAVDTVEDSVVGAQAVVKLSGRASKALVEILGVTEKVQDMSIQTAAATEQQSIVAEDINQNLVGLSEMTSDLSNIANQLNDIALATRSTSQNIDSKVEHFTV